MTKSSVKKLGLTRRIVATSGMAAALFVVAPAAIAAAEDGTGGTTDASSAPAETATEPSVGADASGAGVSGTDGASGTATEPGAGTSDGTSAEPTEPAGDGAGVTPGAGGASDDTTAADDTATEEAAAEDTTTDPPTSGVEPDATPTHPSADDENATSTAEAPTSWFSVGGRHRADTAPTGRHRDDSPPTGRHRADATWTAGANGSTAGETPEVPVVIDEFVGEPGDVVAVAAPSSTGPGSVFYQLVTGSGSAALIFLNQNLTAAGVLNRRGREDGSDYLGSLGPGEQVTVAAQTVAESSAGNRLAVDDTDDSLLAQAIRVVTARLVWAGIDHDNRYLDPSDFQVLIGDNYRIVDNDGITYTYDTDADTITFTNTTDEDVAIIAVDQFNVPHGDGIYVVPAGQSTTIDASGDISGYVMQGQRDSAGRAIIYGMVVVQDDQTLSYNFNPFGGAIRDTADPVADPDDRFWDPSDGLATGILWPTFAAGADGATDGVYYTTDTGGMTIHNDSDQDIAVTVFTGGAASNSLPQTDFYIVEAGGAHRIDLPEGSYAVTSVQGERASDGMPRLYGTLVAQGTAGGPAVTETDTLPGDGIPSITRRTPDAVKPVEAAAVVA
ncbi:hypothetical protein [Gordonia insulae]|uniref:Uncharacterized protein n=1 Tax=Gordonia insulae TaxID=2420509 RepID=A0A3G8JUE0_9ACTN|nr:hypothetical protein [Gordonia insulae]AZG48142.1 hypothetical protein D7316_04755 [Gordonia insulae]